MRVLRMRDQRDAGSPETRIIGGAGNLLAEFGRELAEHGGAMHAYLLEHAPVHHRHHAAAAGLAGVVGARPGRTHEAAGGLHAERRVRRQGVLEGFESGADVVAQGFEPGAGAGLAGVEVGRVHGGTL